MDDTGVPIRKEDLAGRAGKQLDGTAKTREVKLCTIWSAEGRDEEGTLVRDAGSISYTAAIESAAQTDTDETPSAFAARVTRETSRRGFGRAARRAVLGDGAPWIWNLADEHFPDAVQIVDRFHAKQHLSDVAKSLYGATSDLARPWARARHDELDADDLDAVLHALRGYAPHDDEARTCVDYVERNRGRMHYAAFRAAGLCTSTGVVEAGCKTAIGGRCKRTGMHWTVAGANAIIARNGRVEPATGRRDSYRRRHVSTDPVEGRMPDALPKSAGVSGDELARWNARCAPDGRTSRCLLPRLLLGADVRALCRRRDEPYLGRGVDRLRSAREDRTCGCGPRARRRRSHGRRRDSA